MEDGVQLPVARVVEGDLGVPKALDGEVLLQQLPQRGLRVDVYLVRVLDLFLERLLELGDFELVVHLDRVQVQN